MLDEKVLERRLVTLERAVADLQERSEGKIAADRAKNPWLAIAGKYADDPNWEEYQAAIVNARKEANIAEGICIEGESST